MGHRGTSTVQNNSRKIRKPSRIEGIDTPMVNTETDDVGGSDNIVARNFIKDPPPVKEDILL